jgi:hypothetical protein
MLHAALDSAYLNFLVTIFKKKNTDKHWLLPGSSLFYLIPGSFSVFSEGRRGLMIGRLWVRFPSLPRLLLQP